MRSSDDKEKTPPDEPARLLCVAVEEATQEAAKEVADHGAELSEKSAEWVIYGFSLWTIVLPAILAEVTAFTLPQSTAVSTPLWNYLDAFIALIQGGRQLRDDSTHRPDAAKLKGVLNLAGGIQLGILTGVSTTLGAAAAATLCAQGLAIAFGIGFLLSCDEVVRAGRRLTSSEYWFKDSVNQWEKLEEIIPKLERKITALEAALQTKPNKAGSWALAHRRKRLETLQKSQEELGKQIITRKWADSDACDAAYDKYFYTPILTVNSEPGTKLDEQKKRLQKLFSIEITPLVGDRSEDDRKRIMRDSNKRSKQELIKSVEVSILVGLAFAGMLLLCIPGGQPAATVLISISTALFFAKYDYKGLKSLGHCFFKNKNGEGKQADPSRLDVNFDPTGGKRSK